MASRDGANINLELDLSTLIKSPRKLDRALDRGVAGVVKQRSHIAEGWMREEAPWTDRTGNARSGLSAETEHVRLKYHAIHLFYRVPYGIWLEVRHAGKYAIIIPALLDQGPKMMKTLNKLFARLDGGR
jgi:hypothetical protein